MSSTATSPKTRGVHHAGLTVPNVDEAQRFFVEALGFTEVARKPEYPAVFLSDGHVLLTLWQVDDPATARPFDRRNGIGLHHIAFKIGEDQTLAELHTTLAARDDVQIEFSPEPLGDGPTHHLMFRVPGNIRVELIAPGGH
jgi:catechol 2,3-dioxygenase-like lactoylglutathione lyase family enzyme